MSFGECGTLLLPPGTLWRRIVERTKRAVERGALENIPTRIEVVEQNSVEFLVHVAEILEHKREVGRVQSETRANPFLPYDEDLFVADISDTHICLLNKFNVVEHHLLIVTRAFEEQESLLGLRDFEAMWACLREYDGLAFYNAGATAGASQRHKHLQQVPVPLGSGPERTPMDRLLASVHFGDSLAACAGLPFVHALARLDACNGLPLSGAARATRALYLRMLREVGRERDPGPYNLLATREWMLLVPRLGETYETISINALGFAGSILVRNERELALVRDRGPMTLLRHVSVPRDPHQGG